MNERTVKAIANYGAAQDASEAAFRAKRAAEQASRDAGTAHNLAGDHLRKAQRELEDAVWCERHNTPDPELG